MGDAAAGRAYYVAKWVLVLTVVGLMVLVLASLFFVSRFIERRITGPAARLARVAQAVADGDLSKEVPDTGTDDEIGRLTHAIGGMIGELRRLAAALNETTDETSKMTAEITASSEEMAASAGQIAHTAADLSHQSNVMAETIQVLSQSSEELVSAAGDLDAGAREGTERNAQLRSLAAANRARLDESSHALESLSTDAEASAAAIEQLAEASEEIRTFVTLVQKLARQSKLLALNAAMEAARAGDHGHGFAVVAEEVRRLVGDVVGRRGKNGARRERRVEGHRSVEEHQRTHRRDCAWGARRDGARFALVRRHRARRGRGGSVVVGDSVDRDVGQRPRARSAREARYARDRNRVVRGGDAGSGGVERRAEREHRTDRRRGIGVVRRGGSVEQSRGELEGRVGDGDLPGAVARRGADAVAQRDAFAWLAQRAAECEGGKLAVERLAPEDLTRVRA